MEEADFEDNDPTYENWQPAKEWLARYGYCPTEGDIEYQMDTDSPMGHHETDRERSLKPRKSQSETSAVGGLLAFACWQGKMDVCKYLYSTNKLHEKEIRYQDCNGTTPMKCACAGGHLELCKWLCEIGARDDLTREDNAGATPIHWATANNHFETSKWLIFQGVLFQEDCEESIRKDERKGHVPVEMSSDLLDDGSTMSQSKGKRNKTCFSSSSSDNPKSLDCSTSERFSRKLVENYIVCKGVPHPGQTSSMLPRMIAWAQYCVGTKETFVSTFLFGCSHPSTSSYLGILGGVSDIRRYIADFVGVVYGRQSVYVDCFENDMMGSLQHFPCHAYLTYSFWGAGFRAGRSHNRWNRPRYQKPKGHEYATYASDTSEAANQPRNRAAASFTCCLC